MKLTKNQKGFGAVEALIIVAVIVVGLAAFLVVHARQAKHTTPTAHNPISTIQEYQGIQARARDSKDKTNINVMQAQIEAYFANYGTYPTAKQITDSSWRDQNLKAADPTIFTTSSGVAIGQSGGYAYTATPTDCDGTKVTCDNYRLSYKLSDGTTYQKDSLN